MHRRIGRYRRPKHTKSLIFKPGTSFAVCLFPVANGVLFVRNRLGFKVRPLVFSALTLLVQRQEGHPACKKTECWSAGVVICLEQGADMHNCAQLMPLPLTVSCFSKIQVGFIFLVPAHPGSPGQRAALSTQTVLLLTG